MWLYNEIKPLELTLEEITEVIGNKIDKPCKYCGSQKSHYGGCPEISGLFDFDKNKENYSVETVRYSSDRIIEHVSKYSDEYEGYIVDNIEFIDKKGNIAILNDFLPEKTKFIRNKYGYQLLTNFYFNFDPDKNIISYCNLKKKGSLFDLLHEIGHAVDDAHSKKKTKKRLDWEKLSNNFIFKYFLVNRLTKQISREERTAYAYALKIVRYLREKGIEVEPDFDYSASIKENLNRYYESLKAAKKSDFKKEIKRKFKIE